MNQQTYVNYVQDRYQLASDGSITDFLTRRNGHLYLGDRVNLNTLARRCSTPLEVVYYPQITHQVQRMQTWANQARHATTYDGQFIYAYATKANFSAEVVQTALAAGAHYETSSTTDIEIARYLRQQGILPADRLIFCNGSKDTRYTDAICNLRMEGCANVLPVLDDLDEFAELRSCPLRLQFGVRERTAGNRDGTHLGNDRFGLTSVEIDQVVDQIHNTQHQLVLYHAMVGTQIENVDHFLKLLRESVVAYCQLRQRVPTLRYFNFGGGMPTSGYTLDFNFDYAAFLRRLMAQIRDVCRAFGVPMPDLVGEFGRYTVANHSLYLFEIGKVKAGSANAPDWYLLNGSLMVSLPDSVLVEDQQFVILPLEHWDRPVRPVRLAGRQTCDSDDIYPRPSQEPLYLPEAGAGMVIAVCGIGAYQQMLAGRGGAHHCLTPEPRRIVIDDVENRLLLRSVPQQNRTEIMRLLGYQLPQVAPPLRLVPRKRADRVYVR